MEEQSAGKKFGFLKQLKKGVKAANKQFKKGLLGTKPKENLFQADKVDHDTTTKVVQEFHFDMKYYYVYRIFLLIILISFLALFITNAIWHKIIFNEERSQNFHSSDIGHAKKTKYIMLFVLLYLLTIIILFVVVTVIVTIYTKQKYNDLYEENLTRILFADKKVLITFFGLFCLVFGVVIIFMLANKNFTNEMRFPTGNSIDDEIDNEEETSSIQQPKLFLTYFTTFIIALFGLYLVIREVKDNDNYVELGLHCFLIIICLVLAILLIGMFSRKKIKAWVPTLIIIIFMMIILVFVENHTMKV